MAAAVTVIIPTFNRSDMLRAAVASCFRGAPSLNIEVIVVDDCSTESIASALSGFDVKVLRHSQNKRSSAARNTGMVAASGEYIKFLDSDDLLVDGALDCEYAQAIRTDADILVSGWITCTVGQRPDSVEKERFRSAPEFSSILDDLLAGKGVPTSSALYHRRVAMAARWDETMSKLNDWDFFVSAAIASSRIATFEGAAYYWREHAGTRITSSASFLDNAVDFYVILGRLESILRERNELTLPRQIRLAQYLYKELRGTLRFDPVLGRRELEHILSLDPSFKPNDEERSRFFRTLGRLMPMSLWLPAYASFRRLLD